MSHPIIYVLGRTELERFSLILTIGREPNYDDKLINIVGKMSIEEFRSMSGGVWVTAYTQIAKQYFGHHSTAAHLKNLCFERSSSPILFSNAYPEAIPNEIDNKSELRKSLVSRIPQHIDTLFSNHLINRVRLVIQHGIDESESSLIAQNCIKEHCARLGIGYISSPFFYNGNSKGIQQALASVKPKIDAVMKEFLELP